MPNFSEDKLPIVPPETTEKKKKPPIKPGSEDPSYASEVVVVYNDGENFVPIKRVFSMVIVEDINNFYRTGKIVFEDTYDIVENWGFFGGRKKETITISLGLNIESTPQQLVYKFKIYNFNQQPTADSLEKGIRIISADLIEETTFTDFNHAVVNRSFKNMTASEIILDILTTEGKVPDSYINIDKTPDDPIIPCLIVPFWSVEKCLKYLRQYVRGGPYKIFSTHHNQNEKGVKETFCNVVSLKGLHEGYLNNLLQKKRKLVDLYVSQSLASKSGYPISWKFGIQGPSEKDMRNELAGESIMLFDYFTGNHEEKSNEVKDILDNLDIAKYKFKEGDDRYVPEKRTYKSLLSGVYHEGVKHQYLSNSGRYLIHESEGSEHEFSSQYRKLVTEVESKKLSETKMHNRFYDAYYSQFTFQSDMPGYSDIQIGNMYNVILPGRAREDKFGKIESHNIPFSGHWLLARKVHKFRKKNKDAMYKYDVDATFHKSGPEISNALNKVKDHRKVGE